MRESSPMGFFAVHKYVPESSGNNELITSAPVFFCLNLVPSIRNDRRFLSHVIVGLGLPIAGHSSSTVPLLSPMMMGFTGLKIPGGAEKLKIGKNKA